MMFAPSDIELSKKHFEERLKITLGPVELKALMDDASQSGTFVVLDVRDADAYGKEHIPGSVNIPEAELSHRLGELPRDKQIIVYCWSIVCHLGAHAGLTLATHDFFARELEGGIEHWREYKMPLQSASAAAVG